MRRNGIGCSGVMKGGGGLGEGKEGLEDGKMC